MENKKNIRVLTIANNFYPTLNAESLVATKLLNVSSNECTFVVLTKRPIKGPTQDEEICANLTIHQVDNTINIPILKRLKIFSNEKIWVLNVLRRENSIDYDVIYSRSTPVEDHFVGLFLKLMKKKPWIMHLSDPWMDSMYRSKNFLLDPILRYFQKVIFTNADMICVTNDNLREFLEERYSYVKNKIVVIPHSIKTREKSISKKDGDIQMVYLGEFYGIRTPDYFLDILEKTGINKFTLTFVGNKDDDKIMSHAKVLSYKNNLIFFGKKSFKETLEIGRQATYLLLIDANVKNNYFLPSKLMDYLSLGKTIISVTNKNSPTHKILNERHNYILFYEDPEVENVKKLKNILDNHIIWDNDYITKKQLFYDNSKVFQMLTSVFKQINQ